MDYNVLVFVLVVAVAIPFAGAALCWWIDRQPADEPHPLGNPGYWR